MIVPGLKLTYGITTVRKNKNINEGIIEKQNSFNKINRTMYEP